MTTLVRILNDSNSDTPNSHVVQVWRGHVKLVEIFPSEAYDTHIWGNGGRSPHY
jgi:hypothetical protein